MRFIILAFHARAIAHTFHRFIQKHPQKDEIIMENKMAQTPKIKSITSLENDLLSRKLYITIDMMKE